MEIVALFLDEKSACFPLVKTAGDSRQNVDNNRYFKRAIPADSIHLLSRNVTQPTLNSDSWRSGQLLQSYLSNKSARIKSSYNYTIYIHTIRQPFKGEKSHSTCSQRKDCCANACCCCMTLHGIFIN